jgi:GNAT superfamily N-acetyltransferase
MKPIFFVLGALLSSSLFSSEIRIELLNSDSIELHQSAITKVVHQIYNRFPYLYCATDKDYEEYIQDYSRSNSTILCVAFDQEKIVGLAAGTALEESREPYLSPFSPKDVSSSFYLGEFGVADSYQGQGIEQLLYQALEDGVRNKKSYETLCMWDLDRTDLSQMPAEYLSEDLFWSHAGFQRNPDLHFHLSWVRQNEEEETLHRAIYWTKPL